MDFLERVSTIHSEFWESLHTFMTDDISSFSHYIVRFFRRYYIQIEKEEIDIDERVVEAIINMLSVKAFNV